MMLRHLRYLAAVAERGSLTGAARDLRVAQPALSRQLRALEKSVGVPLLERTARGGRPMPAGNELIAIVPAIREGVELGIRNARLTAGGRAGVVRVALSRSVIGDRRIAKALTEL